VTYALKLTLAPAGMSPRDVDDLRGAGLSDGAIHDVAGVVAYYNFVNRMALGLGVELET
jgi:alkylhydroperoxidase family enzyme